MTLQSYQQATDLIDANHPDVRRFAERVTAGRTDDRQRAVRIYYAVRDGWRYNPYRISFEPGALRASRILARPEGHCIDKAVIMIAALRAAGIPARLCLARVCNHIATERLEAVLGTNELVPHGYVEVRLNGKWVKATPAFNRELCERLGVAPLEWDGWQDSLFQEYDRRGGAFMTYLEEFGHFAEVPVDFIVRVMRDYYPHLFTGPDGSIPDRWPEPGAGDPVRGNRPPGLAS